MPLPKNPTYKDFLVAQVVLKSAARGEVSDLMKIMVIIGETAGEGAGDDKVDNLLQELEDNAADYKPKTD